MKEETKVMTVEVEKEEIKVRDESSVAGSRGLNPKKHRSTAVPNNISIHDKEFLSDVSQRTPMIDLRS